MVTGPKVQRKKLGCIQLRALEDGVKNWPWHQAGGYQGFARRSQRHFWELFISTHLMGGACEGFVLGFAIRSRNTGRGEPCICSISYGLLIYYTLILSRKSKPQTGRDVSAV